MIQDQGLKLAEAPKRTIEDIKKEYASVCGAAGDLGYMVKEFESKLDMAHQHLFKLKQEYQEMEAKANVAPPADPPPAQDAHVAEGHPFDETKAP